MRYNAKEIQRLVKTALVAVTLMAAFFMMIGGARPAAAKSVADLPIIGTSPITVTVQPLTYDGIAVDENEPFYSQVASNVVNEPRTVGVVIAKLPCGNRILVDQFVEGFARLSDGTNVLGYVAIANIGRIPPANCNTSRTETSVGNRTIGQMFITASSLTKRSGPGTNFPSKGSLPWGTAVNVVGWDANNYWALTDGGFWLGSGYLSSTRPTTPARASSGGATSNSVCQPIAVTSLTDRGAATVNGTRVVLQVRDVNGCARPLFYNETGVTTGQNYKLELSAGWTFIAAAVSCQVHREGGQATNYEGGPVVLVRGPWIGGFGCYEGAVRLVPTEWEQQILSEVLPIQRTQVGNLNLQAQVHDPAK